jgi:hypothetical protein
MRRAWIALLCCVGLLAGCNAEPTYQSVSVVAYNYTPWDLTSIRIVDASGAVAGSGMIRSGGGEGSVSCCYRLTGTDFTVSWRGGDADLMRKHMFDGKFDDVILSKEAKVHFPYQESPAGEGPLILEVHIYPDEHIELALSRELLGQARIPIPDTTRWLYEHHRDDLVDYEDIHELRYVLAKVTKQAWTKYKIEDAQDMRQYMRLYFTVASNFDSDPQMKTILERPGRAPGDFAQEVMALPQAKLDQIRKTGKPPGDKNA